jgi:Peptidase M15
MAIDWSKYPNFKPDEFKCSFTGKEGINVEIVSILQTIRNELGVPIIVSSGYRDRTHPVEITKRNLGEHTYGWAADILCYNFNAYEFISAAISHGVKRIGVAQIGPLAKRFVHIGIGDKKLKQRFKPTIWSY